jgi:hypothetical protein
MRTLQLAFRVTLLLGLCIPAPIALSTIGHAAAAQSRDELYKKCRHAIFQKYGQPGVQYNRGPKKLVLGAQFVTSAVDRCVASGGTAM